MNNLSVFFVGLFITAATLLPTASKAAITMTPSVDGLGAGTYKPLSSPALTGSGFSATGKVLVNGKMIPIPGYVPLASNASQAAKNALFANPWLVGAALLSWADDAGLGSDVVNHGGWTKTLPADASASNPNYEYRWSASFPWEASGSAACSTVFSACASGGQCDGISGFFYSADYNECHYYYAGQLRTYGGYLLFRQASTCPVGSTGVPPNCVAQPQTRPATKEDFDALPDPSPEVHRELAPQVGVPVGDPVYEPADVPIGDPYTRPDGSTAEPRARISPASNGQVTVDTYDQPLTSPDGQPVTNPEPEDTPEQTDQPTQCDKYPNTLGCAKLDIPPLEDLSTKTRDIALISPVSIGGAGSCPAPLTASFLGQTVEITFDPLCQFANALRPVVLVLAWLSAGVIFIGGVRNG